ncbi:KpsF/GutQ family sugar-phosphate isomerase [Thiohalomonas denitrificans]|uniref:Arabinose 5-phosphate isomerase n=1 Tax=Thiohalomonas denitrificans TaxID=415747 RepID=A0A1G5PMB2_9GAMM|nr:KpsF/GutQ family sugar-phosphate isomerase [Thiohalomonas denitrificans]SCZ50597.1 arabinose-5-phosphate isomerase [Thiohalomonas denitrificans]
MKQRTGMPRTTDDVRLCDLGRAVLETESRAVACLAERLDGEFAAACRLMLACEGRVVVTGMGKSGHIGAKIAATLASTGTPAFFVHPGEASHGDLGMITPKDVVLALSNSGETDELLTILPLIKRLAVPMIALTGKPASRLAQTATVHIDVSVEKEACPLGLAPTASTTATLAMGDAMAVALLESRGFTAEDFARSHPAGTLGRRLLLRIEDLMHTGEASPQVHENARLSEALVEMTEKGLGMTSVVDAEERLIGIFTDGDLRRLLDHGDFHFSNVPIAEVMHRGSVTAGPAMLAAEALQIMESRKINALPVVDDEGKLLGALNMHDLLRAGVV